ncbi:MAG: ImmA/IrrE family metallo-endopeptidase [Chlorobi bacterium]|nr:ImmA/IrrE family metallo-endopeptidase [Chlorobiota bacterium]
MRVEHNISRLNYLLNLYKISTDELLVMINLNLKNKITKEDITSNTIDLRYLKRIDKIFNKGLSFYLDPKNITKSKEASIFFRKNRFNSELNIGAKKIVNHFEEIKLSLSAVSKLAEIDISRKVPVYSIKDDPKKVAKKIRKILYPDFNRNLKTFLKSIISKLADSNILVFEFVETWNKKETANIDGFFINPNVIVIKRYQRAFRREIFTLIHELGHFLINEEEIEKISFNYLAQENLSKIERWCNDFSYHFLAGEHGEILDNIERATEKNDFHFSLIDTISKETHLSRIALFTRLLYQKKISEKNYNTIKARFNEEYRLKREEEKLKKEAEKEMGIKHQGRSPQPIKSPLLISTVQTAFYEGILNEYQVCKTLNINPKKLDKYLL